MTDELRGHINEARRLFTSGDITGEVEFGHAAQGADRRKATTFRVKLSNGREGYGRYYSPENVRVILKARRGRYGRKGAGG